MAIAHDLYKNIGNIDVFTESELLQVKVPMGCFSRPRDGHQTNKSRRFSNAPEEV